MGELLGSGSQYFFAEPIFSSFTHHTVSNFAGINLIGTFLDLLFKHRDAVFPDIRSVAGDVECTRCSSFVAYDSMSLDEDGAFCAACVERLTAVAAR